MSSTKYLVLGIILLFTSSNTFAQDTHTDSVLNHLDETDLIDFLVSALKLGDHGKVNRTSQTGDVLFSVIPIAPSSSGDGKIAVSAINASFYTAKETNISTVYFYPYTNLAGSYGVVLSPNIWFDRNNLNGLGDFRFVHNGIPDYGLGTNTKKSDGVNIQYEQIRTYFTAHTRVKGIYYMGAGYNLDYFYSINEKVDPAKPPSDFSKYGIGTGSSSSSSGVTFNMLRDNRKNSINPSQGLYAVAIFRLNKKEFGSTYNWNSLYLEGRRYKSFSKKRHKIFAYRAIYWATYGNVPYYNLPATFQDLSGRAGRGYSSNRFRGKQMLFAEAEYRFDISHRGFLGGVVFANMESFTEPEDEKFHYIAPAAGFGVRLKFNRNSDTNLTLDFAYGKDGPNFYVNLGEFF